MSVDISLLKTICSIPGAPGFEKRIRDKIEETIQGFTDELYTDNLGNLISIRHGENNSEGKRILIAAHMDEIGFVVTHIDDNGFLKFHTLGGFDPKTLTAQRVIVHGKEDLMGVMGSKPIHIMSEDEQKKPPKITDYFIDLGMPKEEVEKFICIGDPVTRERELVEMGECISCKSLDNRICVYILAEAIKKLHGIPWDVYTVFTVQEELGMRGANVVAHQINPDFGLVLDTTVAFDVPGSQPHERVTSLGHGVAIKIMDSSVVCDPRMVKFLKSTANDLNIIWQPEILTAGGTDTAGIQRMGKSGAISGAISIPTRHLHQVIEMVHSKDVLNAVDLLVASLTKIDKWNWDN